jgi:uncharacterized protein with LGFP repeats
MTESTPSLPGLIRHWLGTDRITELEATMATVVEALQALTAQQAEASAAQTASFSNLQAAVERLETAVANGEVSPEIQSAVDQLSAGFTAMKEAADAADDGTEPTP